jgi:teichoic acid transport system permease protein
VTTAQRGTDTLFPVGAQLDTRDYLRAIWRMRDFVLQVPLGRLRAQTHSTVLGGLWHLLNPLLFAGVYYFVFGVVFRGREGIPNYAAFLIAGLFSFLYTQRVATTGAGAITSNRSLIGQVNFPRASLPLSATLAETISHGWSMLALLGIVLLTGESVSPEWLLLLPLLTLQCIFNLGLALIVARLGFRFRDVQQFLPYALRMWMYLSGIFYSLAFVESRVSEAGWLIELFEWNPAYAYATLTRAALLEGQEAGLQVWLVAAVWALLLVVGGFFFFRRREIEYAGV